MSGPARPLAAASEGRVTTQGMIGPSEFVQPNGDLTPLSFRFLHSLFRLTLPLLTNAADDAAAASAGIAVGQFYRNGSAVMQRVT
jgi:hypothetical protein